MTLEPNDGLNSQPRDACPDRETIRRIVRGLETDHDLEAFADHLVQCEACCEIFERMLKAAAPFDRLSERVEARPSVSPSISRWRLAGSRFGGFLIYGRFRFVSKVGGGTIGEVHKAFDIKLSRTVAVKAIPADRFEPGTLERLTNEVCFQACLNHPRIVTIHDIVLKDGLLMIVMEWIAGGSLSDALESGPLDSHCAARLIGHVARALQFAHDNGVVHSAVKPSNILLTMPGSDSGTSKEEPETAKLGDFGMARDHGEWIVGNGKPQETLVYRAPELFSVMRSQSTPASDIYAVGVTLYEALTGRRPFRGESASALIETIRTVEPIPPRSIAPGIDPRLESICLRCLEKDPAHRYTDARQLAVDLEACAAVRPEPPTPSLWARLRSGWCGGGPRGG